MTPTRSQISQGLTKLHLWIDRTSMLLTAMKMEFPNGDAKLMAFENVQVNGTVDPKLFSIEAVTDSAPPARSHSREVVRRIHHRRRGRLPHVRYTRSLCTHGRQ